MKRVEIVFEEGVGFKFSWRGNWSVYEALGVLELAKQDVLERGADFD